MKKIVLILMFSVPLCFSSEISIKNVTEIINGQNPQLNGYIQNLQVAPFDNNLVSFEVTDDTDATVKLFLYNMKTKNMLRIESTAYSEEPATTRRRYYVKDQGLRWHPYKNWFVFYGNGFQDREQVYICRVVVPELINNFAVNGYRVILKENLNEERSFSKDPAFDMTGDNLFFTRRVEKRDRQARYNRTYNITGIQNVFAFMDNRFRGVDFKTVLDARFDQTKPLPSPSDRDLIAYISFKNQETRGQDYYAEYSLNIINLANAGITVVDNMDGYQDYAFFWSNTGSQIFYFKALSLLRTPQKFIDDKVNQVNLHFVRIEKAANRVSALPQTNPRTDILLEDVVAKESWVTFVNDNNIVAAKWDPYASLYLVDINLWRKADRKFEHKIAFNRDFDTSNPVMMADELLYISESFVRNRTITAVQSSRFSLSLTDGEARDLASTRSEIDKREVTGEGDVYQEDTPFDDSDAYVFQPSDTQKQTKIAELERKKADLQVEMLKTDNLILSEQNNVENIESEIRNLTKQSSDKLDAKNTALARINDIRLTQTRNLQTTQQLVLKQNQLTLANTEKLKLETEILTLENSILTERETILNLERQGAEKNNQIVGIRRTITNLRIDQTRTLETEGKLASFESQLLDLIIKNTDLHEKLEKDESELGDLKKALASEEKVLADKRSNKEKLIASVDKLKSDRLLSVQQDRDSRLRTIESGIASNRQNLTEFDNGLVEAQKDLDSENKLISGMIEKVKDLNNDKIAALNRLTELRSQKLSVEKEQQVVTKDEPEKTEVVSDGDYYEDDDDFTVDQDVFDDVTPASSRRRGRR